MNDDAIASEQLHQAANAAHDRWLDYLCSRYIRRFPNGVHHGQCKREIELPESNAQGRLFQVMIFGDDGVIDMAQIGTGYRFRIDRIQNQENYFEWYAGELDTLWPPASIKNGLKLLDVNTDLIRMNVFAVCADYYVDSILSTMPLMISPDDALNAWLEDEDNTKPVVKALEKAVLHWSVTGMFVMAVFEGDGGPKVRAVSPVHFVAVVDPTDEEDIIGYNLVYTVEQFIENDPNRYRTVRAAPTGSW